MGKTDKKIQHSVNHVLFPECIVYHGFDIVGPKQNAAPCASKGRDAMVYTSINLYHSDMRTAGYLAKLTVA